MFMLIQLPNLAGLRPPMAVAAWRALDGSAASARSTRPSRWCCAAAAPSATALARRLQCCGRRGLDEVGCRAAARTRPSSASAVAAPPSRCSSWATCAPARCPHPLGRPPACLAAGLRPFVVRLLPVGGAVGGWPGWHPDRSVCPIWVVWCARLKRIPSIYPITHLPCV